MKCKYNNIVYIANKLFFIEIIFKMQNGQEKLLVNQILTN